MKSVQISQEELEMIRKALRWTISDLSHTIKVCAETGEQPPTILCDLVKWKALEKKIASSR